MLMWDFLIGSKSSCARISFPSKLQKNHRLIGNNEHNKQSGQSCLKDLVI